MGGGGQISLYEMKNGTIKREITERTQSFMDGHFQRL